MTLADIRTMLLQANVPVYYNHAPNGISVPFIIYRDTSDNFGADNKVYHKALRIDVELYSTTKDTTLESTLESVFDNERIFWEKEIYYMPDNEVYQTNYSMEV